MTPLDDTTQQMLYAGIKWLEDHPAAIISYEHHQPGATGMIYSNTAESERLMHHVIAVVKGECTGAQIEDVLIRLGFIHQHGWDAYAERVRTSQSLLEPPAGESK